MWYYLASNRTFLDNNLPYTERTILEYIEILFSHNFWLQVIGAYSLEEMVAKLKRPRRIMLMVKAGQAVDDFIHKLVPLLSKGDIIIGKRNVP